MAKVTQAEKAQIKHLMRDPAWSAVLRFLDKKLTQWKDESITGKDAFEELRALHTRDGKVAGVTELFEQMESEANS